MRARTVGTWYVSLAVRALTMLLLSHEVTATNVSVWSIPAASSTDRLKPLPAWKTPGHPASRGGVPWWPQDAAAVVLRRLMCGSGPMCGRLPCPSARYDAPGAVGP